MASIDEILQGDLSKAIDTLCTDDLEARTPDVYREEFEGKRTRRIGSVGMREDEKVDVYSDTDVDEEGNPLKLEPKTIRVSKIITNTPERIVNTAVSFLCGGDISISAKEENDAISEFREVYINSLQMHSIWGDAIEMGMIESKVAIVFYPIVKVIDGQQITKLKVKVLSSVKDGEFYIHKDDFDDMDAFIHKYTTKIEGKEVECLKIYKADKILTYHNIGGWQAQPELVNLFGVIPVVYVDFKYPAWEQITSAMDGYEVGISRLVDGNKKHSQPILLTYGDASLPSKETIGRSINFPLELDPDSGKEIHGDAKYLESKQAMESTKLELDTLRNEIFAGSDTPDFWSDALKGMNDISGVAMELRFLPAIIKAKKNMRTVGPALKRSVSIVKAGMANITHVKQAKQIRESVITVKFASILPKNVKELIANLSTAMDFNSKETIITHSPFTTDVISEIEKVKEEAREERNINPYG